MVKNTSGGCKAKGQARKFAAPTKPTNILRVSRDPCEMYAQATKLLGNGMCHVLCMDGRTRLCHIRGKFRGRGKRDCFVNPNSWLLVGLREWEVQHDSGSGTKASGKLQNCDLLEVYDDFEKERLKNTVTNVNWAAFIANDNKVCDMETGADNAIEFTDERSAEYAELMELAASAPTTITTTTTGSSLYSQPLNIDDI
jgi:initiation factor 1A